MNTQSSSPRLPSELLSAREFLITHGLEIDDLLLLAARGALPSITVINGKPKISQTSAFEWRARRALETL